jgi:hypothetical protein
MAKQNLRDRLIRAGLELLKSEDFDVERHSPDLIPLLRQRFGKERSTNLAVIHLLGRIVDPASAAALQEVAVGVDDKEVQREIRRSLFRLSQKGIAVPSKGAEPEDASKPRFTLTPEIEGYLSPLDAGGNYLLVLARPQAGSGLFVIQAAINDRQGLQRVGGTVIRRREFREMMDDMNAQHGISMVPIPWRYGDWRLYTSYEQARALGAEGIDEYPALRSRLTNAVAQAEPHPVFSRLDKEEIVESVRLDASRRLLEETELRMWLIDEDLLLPYIERVAALRDSRIVLSSIQQQQRFEAIVKEAVEGIFLDDAFRPVFERRLEDVALQLVESKREDKAKSALRVALALERKELGGLVGVPLLEELVRRSLALYMAREKEKASEPSLIIKP